VSKIQNLGLKQEEIKRLENRKFFCNCVFYGGLSAIISCFGGAAYFWRRWLADEEFISNFLEEILKNATLDE
jgi:hypothetical protein